MKHSKYTYSEFVESLTVCGFFENIVANEFLGFIRDTSESRRTARTPAEPLWRAQQGTAGEDAFVTRGRDGTIESGESVPVPHPKKRMKPLIDRAVEGRVNRKGVAVLYLSMDPDTCVAELRPRKHALVTVAQFKLTKEVFLVDCTTDSPTGAKFTAPQIEHEENQVWESINRAFMRPVGREADLDEYSPTQVISDVFRKQFDGIIFASGLETGGKNVALYDLELAKCGSRHVRRVIDLKVESSRVPSPSKGAQRLVPPPSY